MKRLVSILVVLIFFAFPLTLHADVVMGNSFFYENADKAEKISEKSYGKSFIINSPMGYVIPVEEPGSSKGIPTDKGYSNYFGAEAPDTDVFIFKNGEIKTITAVYLFNGEYWGVMAPSHIYQPSGWVLMDDLLMIYALEDFETENKDKIYTYTGTFNTLPLKKLIVWQWPGSDREKIVMDVSYTENYAKVYYAYKDSESREWGEIGSGWICLSDPENKTDIPSFNPALKPVKWSHDGNRDWTKEAKVWPRAEPPFIQANPYKFALIIVILSSALVFAVVTIGLICRIKHKKS